MTEDLAAITMQRYTRGMLARHQVTHRSREMYRDLLLSDPSLTQSESFGWGSIMSPPTFIANNRENHRERLNQVKEKKVALLKEIFETQSLLEMRLSRH